MVTEDCAIAVPEAASTARAIRDFFIASYSKVKQRAPDREDVQRWSHATMKPSSAQPVPRANLLVGKLSLLQQTPGAYAKQFPRIGGSSGSSVVVPQQPAALPDLAARN
ncbi:hypothetical protein MASR1M59_07870 [Melaminivora sp.]